MDEKIIDPCTGAELRPGDPDRCQGNGSHPDYECCCDECDHYLDCYPEWDAEKEAEERARAAEAAAERLKNRGFFARIFNLKE